METIADLYKGLNMVFKETKNLLEIVLTYPITSNKGERSFSSLKLLLSSSRTTMCESRMCNLARMAIHSSRVNALENNVIVKQYADAYPRRLSYRITEDEDENNEGSICLFFLSFIFFNCSWARILCTHRKVLPFSFFCLQKLGRNHFKNLESNVYKCFIICLEFLVTFKKFCILVINALS